MCVCVWYNPLIAGKLNYHIFFSPFQETTFITDCGKFLVEKVADRVKQVYHCTQSNSLLQVPEAVAVK